VVVSRRDMAICTFWESIGHEAVSGVRER
jgi:hypothetical protein